MFIWTIFKRLVGLEKDETVEFTDIKEGDEYFVPVEEIKPETDNVVVDPGNKDYNPHPYPRRTPEELQSIIDKRLEEIGKKNKKKTKKASTTKKPKAKAKAKPKAKPKSTK